MTEIFPDDDPYLDEDTVFGVRSDLVMKYVERPASEFPEGYELSGKIHDTFLVADFDEAGAARRLIDLSGLPRTQSTCCRVTFSQMI